MCTYVRVCVLSCPQQFSRNDLPISSRIWLFVNNSLHPKGKVALGTDKNQDDYVGYYINAGGLHLIALV
ncbi:MAG: hypothetical protein ACJ70V_02205 [Nitrososphaera sp.]